jgi:hypothetical protein
MASTSMKAVGMLLWDFIFERGWIDFDVGVSGRFTGLRIR